MFLTLLVECNCGAIVILWTGAYTSSARKLCSNTDYEPEWLKRLQLLVMNLAFLFGKSAWLV